MKKIIILVIALIGLYLPFYFWYDLRLVGNTTDDWHDYPERQGLEPTVPALVVSNYPSNIIIFVADGLGFAHLTLAMAMRTENSDTVWDNFSAHGWHQPHPHRGFLIDSAASATALSTGFLAWNGVVGMNPETKEPMENLFEVAQAKGYQRAVVTDSYIWDATPAAFLAHVTNRDDGREILRQINESKLDVLFGELEDVGEGDIPDKESTIRQLQQNFRMLDASLSLDGIGKDDAIAAVFDEESITNQESSPTLTRMVEVALARLSMNDKPFVLLVESEEMDSASHHNDSQRVVEGLEVIESALAVLGQFTQNHPDTLVLFTSDHETGGLTLGTDDFNSKVHTVWSTYDHTGVVVPVMAVGPGADAFEGVMETTQIGRRLKALLNQKPVDPAQ